MVTNYHYVRKERINHFKILEISYLKANFFCFGAPVFFAF